MQETLIEQGAELMIYGMGTVFVFLTLLVVLTALMSALLQRFIPPPSLIKPDTPQAPLGDDPHIVAAITAAIHQHRTRRK